MKIDLLIANEIQFYVLIFYYGDSKIFNILKPKVCWWLFIGMEPRHTSLRSR